MQYNTCNTIQCRSQFPLRCACAVDIACSFKSALVSIVSSPSSTDHKSFTNHTCLLSLIQNQSLITKRCQSNKKRLISVHYDDYPTYNCNDILFQWKTSAGVREERYPSTTSRRKTSRETSETSAMVIIINITWENLKSEKIVWFRGQSENNQRQGGNISGLKMHFNVQKSRCSLAEPGKI